MTRDERALRARDARPSPSRGSARWLPLGLSLAGLGWSLLLVVAIWTVPLITVNTGVPGLQPRETLATAGDRLGITVFSTTAATALIITVLVAQSQRGGQRRSSLATIALLLAILVAVLAAVALVTILIGLYVLPAAAVLVIATMLARQP
ncbi:MAG: hypothetical protein ACXVXN_07210 [Mycobacteriaceae bacterium]